MVGDIVCVQEALMYELLLWLLLFLLAPAAVGFWVCLIAIKWLKVSAVDASEYMRVAIWLTACLWVTSLFFRLAVLSR